MFYHKRLCKYNIFYLSISTLINSALLLFSSYVFAYTADDPSFRFYGDWNITLIESYNTCSQDDPARYEYSGFFDFVSSTQIKTIAYDGITYTGTVQGSTADFNLTVPESGGTGQTTFSLTLDSQQINFTGQSYYVWSDDYESCEIGAQISGRKTVSAVQFQILTKDGIPLKDVTVEFKSNTQDQQNISANSGAQGYASFSAVVGISGTATFKKQGYSIEPSSVNIDNLSANRDYLLSATAVESEEQARAIIIAGGGDIQDPLWTAINNTGHFAYRSLLYKGINKDNIRYFNAQTEQDVDKDGSMNDILSAPTRENIYESITSWAKASVTKNIPLIIYMLDHGLEDTFFISKSNNQTSSTINSATLDSWLDELQAATGVKVILIYDACFSGSFMQGLKATTGQQRILIFSSAKDELAYFGAHGDLSFSNFFWTHILKGKSIRDVFRSSQIGIRSATNNVQNPQMDDDGDGVWNSHSDGALASLSYLGNPFVTAAALPQIISNSGNAIVQDRQTVTIEAKVDLSVDKIDKVWATIVSPTAAQGTTAIVALPEFELTYNADKSTYQAQLSGLDQNGVYLVVIYARANDKSAFVSLPATLKLAVSHSQSSGASVTLENNRVQLNMTNISFKGQNFRAILQLIDSPPNHVYFSLLDRSIGLASETDKVDAILSEVSFGIHIPAIFFDNKYWNVKLKLVAGVTQLIWELEKIEANK
ncbi:MAG: hypothetical protein KZQ83_09090 [gamma proteobacterium symbiont of Taylorina sp.]|nr:hypothetical protein [gamma proteobacterium symbiont of Taylorina sp.]